MIVPCRSVGCTEIIARFEVEPDRLEHLLPDGFSFAARGGGAAPAESAELIVRLLRADETTSVSGRTTFGGNHACLLVAVEPPPGLELRGGGPHAIELYAFRDGAVSIRSRPDGEGGWRFRGCAVHLPVMLTVDGAVPGGGALPVPASTMRIFFSEQGEVGAIADVGCTTWSESRPGQVRVQIDGLTTLPATLDGIGVLVSGFDATVTLAQPSEPAEAGKPAEPSKAAQASAAGRSALPQPNLS